MQFFAVMARRNCLALIAVLFLLLAAAGCKAQDKKASGILNDEVIHRIQKEIRSRFNVRDDINISISPLRPTDLPGFDEVTVSFTGGARNSSFVFLISKDHKTLAHMDLKVDISGELMSKIEVKGRPFRGSEKAKVVIINFQDFECPFCTQLHTTLFPGLMQDYASRVKVVYKDYPLVEIHPWAMHAAVDANCLADQSQDAYWDFADYVFSNRKLVGGQVVQEAFLNLDKAVLDQATKHKLDTQKVAACTQKQDESAVRASMAEGNRIGVDSTPTMIINGESYSGAIPADKLRDILNRALAEHP